MSSTRSPFSALCKSSLNTLVTALDVNLPIMLYCIIAYQIELSGISEQLPSILRKILDIYIKVLGAIAYTSVHAITTVRTNTPTRNIRKWFVLKLFLEWI